MFAITLLSCEVLRRRLLVFLNVHRLINDVAPQSLSCTEGYVPERGLICVLSVCSCSHNVKKKKKKVLDVLHPDSPATWSIFCRMFCLLRSLLILQTV